VLDIDEDRRRISLGMKQCLANPWEDFDQGHAKGDRVSGKIKSITDFGIFIGLDGGIDGLVHLSDISWHATGEEAVRQYKKGQEVDAVVLAVDPERERISLLLKEGDEVEAKFIGVDRKNRTITLSIKAKDMADEADVLQDYSRRSGTGATLGDIFKEQMSAPDE